VIILHYEQVKLVKIPESKFNYKSMSGLHPVVRAYSFVSKARKVDNMDKAAEKRDLIKSSRMQAWSIGSSG
jgi:hypothetical protein